MSDIRVSMREFRFLEEKRKLAALSQAEEQRWIELGQMLGIFEVSPHPPAPEAQQPQGYYAADGNWYPYAGSFPAQAYPQAADGAVGAEAYGPHDPEMGELLRFTDSPAEAYAGHSASMQSGFDPTTPAASQQQLNGVSGLDPNEVMEVDPNDVFLVEQVEGESASSVADHLGPAAQGGAPSTSPEHSSADGDAIGQTDASLPLTQSFEWIPASPPPENALPFDSETPALGEVVNPAVTAEQPAPEIDSVEPSDASIPLTKNFEWIPPASPPEGSVPLNEGWSDARAGDPSESVQANAVAEPQPVDEASGSDSPVIDLLESDAMQAEVEPSSWAEQIPQSATAAETGMSDLPSAVEPLEVEPVAQWTGEAEASAPPAGSEQPKPIATERLPEVAKSFPSDSSSALPRSEVSSSASAPSSFQFVPATNFQPQRQATPVRMNTRAAETEIAPRVDDAPSSPPFNAADVQPSQRRDSPTADAAAVHSNEVSHPPAAVSAQFGDGKELLSSSFVQGDRRVVIHLLDGQVKRGELRDADLMASHIPLHSSTDTLENIPIDRIKAIFFMVAPGSQRPALHGQKVRLTFQDGREVVGFSTDYKTGDPGFFVTPADARSNTERIFVLRWSVLSIDER